MSKELNEYAKNTIEYIMNRKEKLKKIISDKLYINWLKEFSKTHPSFNSENIIYDDEISKEEQTNALNINLLIDALYSYCEKTKTVDPIVDKQTTFKNYHFNIKDGDFNFTVGRIYGQGCLEYFNLGSTESEQVIDFNDLIDYSQHTNKNEDSMEK